MQDARPRPRRMINLANAAQPVHDRQPLGARGVCELARYGGRALMHIRCCSCCETVFFSLLMAVGCALCCISVVLLELMRRYFLNSYNESCSLVDGVWESSYSIEKMWDKTPGGYILNLGWEYENLKMYLIIVADTCWNKFGVRNYSRSSHSNYYLWPLRNHCELMGLQLANDQWTWWKVSWWWNVHIAPSS